jgi:tRNA-Thr(GGU) m(6)t(6)A37 methyltransferase TsaA
MSLEDGGNPSTGLLLLLLASVVYNKVACAGNNKSPNIMKHQHQRPPKPSKQTPQYNMGNKQQQQQPPPSSLSSTSTTTTEVVDPHDAVYPMRPIGTLSSIYPLCVGTPRQGALVPTSRARITLNRKWIGVDSLEELQSFSHVWVVFLFHLNSNDRAVAKSSDSEKQKDNKCYIFPSKISPPSLGGKKVGVFASRTPHRPNPLGFSLCKIERIIKPGKHTKEFGLEISGVDLVDGTPVIDIKPFVPHYDSVGYNPSQYDPTLDYMGDSSKGKLGDLKLPAWVYAGLDKRRTVVFENDSIQSLTEICEQADSKKGVLKFYGAGCGGADQEKKGCFDDVRQCVLDILAVDVRSKYQTANLRKGGYKAIDVRETIKGGGGGEKREEGKREVVVKVGESCTQHVDLLVVYFVVEEVEDDGSGEGGE